MTIQILINTVKCRSQFILFTNGLGFREIQKNVVHYYLHLVINKFSIGLVIICELTSKIASKMFQTLLIYGITFIAIIITTVYAYCKYKYTYWERNNIPYLTPTFPFGSGSGKSLFFLTESFGNAFRSAYLELKKKTSSFGGFYLFSQPMLMVIDPELAKNILTKDFGHFHDRGVFVDEENDPLGAHLVTLSGQKWKTARAKITPTFTSGKMKLMFHTMLETSKELGNIFDRHIKQKEPIDIKDIFARQATDVIGSCAFGLDCNSLKDPNTEFRVYGKKVFVFGFRESFINVIATVCPRLLKLLKIPQTRPDITNFFMNVLKQTVDYREKNNIHRKDFLDLMIRLRNNQSVLDDSTETKLMKDNEEGMTFNELAAHSFVFFAAGFETTSSTLNFCLFELVSNPEIQEKVRKEVLDVTGKYDGTITYEGIMEMKYMEKVFQEVLRKYPPLPILQRECTEDYKIPESDFTIKKGTVIVISTMGFQHDPEHYPDPDKFDPERFSEEEKSKRHPYTHLPFGEGPRVCIGNRFALLQVKIVLSKLLMDFKFKLDPKTVTPIVFDPKSIFLSPIDTVWLQAERIQK